MRRGFGCHCNVAMRATSTLATRALEELAKLDQKKAALLIREANEHVARIRKECRC